MKKVLLTSTALVAFAGAAAAEVTISGWAEMGVVGGSDVTSQFFNDVDVDFDMTGESDGGLTFGTSVDLDTAAEDTKSMKNEKGEINDFSVFVSGEWGTVTMGDIDGAVDWAVAGVETWGDPGTIDDSETAHFGRQDTYLDGSYDGQILRYDYSWNDFGVAVSLEQDDRNDYELRKLHEDRHEYDWAIGGKWNPQVGPGTLMLGIGYQRADAGKVSFDITNQMASKMTDVYADLSEEDQAKLEDIASVDSDGNVSNLKIGLGNNASVVAVSAGYVVDSGVMEGFQFGGTYSDWQGDDFKNGSYWGLGIGYAFDAWSFHANVGQHEFKRNHDAGKVKLRGAGAAIGYDLGGGLSALAGYGYSHYKLGLGIDTDTWKDDQDFSTWSVGGLSMAF